MIVMKFGGTSVGDAARIRVVAGLVKGSLPRDPVVICSAHSGVTNALLKAAEEAGRGTVEVAALVERHRRITGDLGVEAPDVERLLAELEETLRGVALSRRVTPRALDLVASFGERLSCRTVAAFLRRQGVDAQAFDAYDIGFLTDSNFTNAAPLAETFGNIRARLEAVRVTPVITGFIGKSLQGDVTTIGRGGSDYSASIIGAAIGAREIQIWTDVDGVMTADPSLVREAKPIPEMTFEEAGELAYFGARVLHPATVQPAVESGIPVRVLNTYNPTSPGTLIVPRLEREDPRPVTSVAYKENLTVVNLVSTRLLMAHGFLAQIFTVFGEERIAVDMVSTSEISVSCTVDARQDAAGVERAARRLAEVATVSVEKEQAIVCVVGHRMRQEPGIAGRVFSAVARAGVNVRMISQGASKINLTFVVHNRDIEPAVKVLHREFFGT
ncbi:MAG: aspartate kinase [Planctomycetes bacterium]|nr:aspartate kinase [Planctomycetota bacterium]